MIDTLFAPVSIEQLSILDTSMHINGTVSEREVNVNLEFEVSADSGLRSEGDNRCLDVRLRAKATLKDDDSVESALIDVTATGTFSVPIDMVLNEVEAHGYLKLNGVSILYGHIRTYMMLIASMTPIQGLILPPVIPQALIRSGQ